MTNPGPSAGLGGFGSFPLAFGDASDSIHEVMLNALLAAQGSALAIDVNSSTYVECYAKARCLADLWSSVIRLSNQFDPEKMSDFLPRWEAIYGIIPSPSSTLAQRRAVIANKISNFGKSPTIQVITDLLALILGPVFVKIIYGSDVIPDGYYAGLPGIVGYVPGGANVPGGFNFPQNPIYTPFGVTKGQSVNQIGFSSTMAYLAILVQQPVWMSNQQFLNTVGQIDYYLEDTLPAWTTFDWVQNNSDGYGGFILDDTPFNLDGEFFLP